MRTLAKTFALATLSLATLSVGTRIARADGVRESGPELVQTVGLRSVDLATNISLQAIEIVDQLEGVTNYADWGLYLLPIKKAAAQSYAEARAFSEISEPVVQSLRALEGQISQASDFINNYMERSDDFDAATELLTLQDQIQSLLNG